MIDYMRLRLTNVRWRAAWFLIVLSLMLESTCNLTAADELQNDGASLVRDQDGGFSDELPKSVQAMLEGIEADSRRITVRQATLFHQMLLRCCVEPLREGKPQLEPLSVDYKGPLHRETGRSKLNILGQGIGGMLQWRVAGEIVVFSIWISTNRLPDTVATCSIEGLDLHVNVSGVDKQQGVDVLLPELGDRSVRSVLKLLEEPRGQ